MKVLQRMAAVFSIVQRLWKKPKRMTLREKLGEKT